ncbi:conserved hypothetical protein, partial [Streptomyces griseoflavus Tu4000]
MKRYDDDGGDLERTFAALPPARGRGFARTWWGTAWLTALEDTALDNGQLKAGRRLARAGAVGAVSVRPGRVTAVVRDRDGTAHRADVLLQELSGEQWERFLAMAVERAGHVAALLDGEMPTQLVEDAEPAGIELLPGIGDLEPECGCDAWDHCAHTAALCYQVARLLDEDPFVLLLMRGRGERALLEALRTRSGASAGRPAAGAEGVDAAEAYAARDILPSLPDAPALPPEPGVPPVWDTEAEPGAGIYPGRAGVPGRPYRRAGPPSAGGGARGRSRAAARGTGTGRRAGRGAAGRRGAGPRGGGPARRGLGAGAGRTGGGRTGLAVRRCGGACGARRGVDAGRRAAGTRACRPGVGLGRGRTAGTAVPGQPVDGRR